METDSNAVKETRSQLAADPDRTRRRLIQAAGGALAAGSLPGGLAYAAGARRTLKVGFVSPRTGPLAGFGECDPFALSLARKALAKGLRVEGKTWHVEIIDRDTQS
ncbi:MAG: ABC transporter substrate-binding protein, partial [Burkholderiales bacterium]